MADLGSRLCEAPGVTPPTLQTERLVMRLHLETDLDAAAAMWGDPEITRHIGGRPFTREEVWHRILKYRGHWTMRPYGYWAVTERKAGCFIGEVGLADWKRSSLADLPDEPEAGWVFSRGAQRKGYAREALARVLTWADEALATSTICVIENRNDRSIRLAESVGFRYCSSSSATPATPRRYRRMPGGSNATPWVEAPGPGLPSGTPKPDETRSY